MSFSATALQCARPSPTWPCSGNVLCNEALLAKRRTVERMQMRVSEVLPCTNITWDGNLSDGRCVCIQDEQLHHWVWGSSLRIVQNYKKPVGYISSTSASYLKDFTLGYGKWTVSGYWSFPYHVYSMLWTPESLNWAKATNLPPDDHHNAWFVENISSAEEM